MRIRSAVTALTLAAALAPAALAAQLSLPLGKTAEGSTSGDPASFALDVEGPGFLLVVVRSSAGEDLTISVTDAEGQLLPDGKADADLGGDVGAEQLTVTIPARGRYSVVVRAYGEKATFQIGGAFLPSGLAASPDDPDGRPSGAIELAVGEAHDDVIDPPAGDRADWYRIPIQTSGVLTIFTRAQGDGDLKLERYVAPEFGEPSESSDEDRDGVAGNETLTLDVKAGDVVLIRVVPAFWGATTVPYKIASGIIAG